MNSNEEIILSSLCDRIMAACDRLNKRLDVIDEQRRLFTYTDSYAPLQYPAPTYVTSWQTTAETYFHQPLPPPYTQQQSPPSNTYQVEDLWPPDPTPPYSTTEYRTPPNAHQFSHQNWQQMVQPSYPPAHSTQQVRTQPPPQHPRPNSRYPPPPPPQHYFLTQPPPSQDYHQPQKLSSQQLLPTAALPHQNYPQVPPPKPYQPPWIIDCDRVEEGFADSTKKIPDYAAGFGGVEKVEKMEKSSPDSARKEKPVQGCIEIECSRQLNASRIKILQAQIDLGESIVDNASLELLGDSSQVREVASMNHRSTSLDADARLIPPRNDMPYPIVYCHKCLLINEEADVVDALEEWGCLKYIGIWNCIVCITKKGIQPAGLYIDMAKKIGLSSVSAVLLQGDHYLSCEKVDQNELLRAQCFTFGTLEELVNHSPPIGRFGFSKEDISFCFTLNLIQSERMVMEKLKIGRAWSEVLDVELDVGTGAMFRQELVDRSGCACLKLISAGKSIDHNDNSNEEEFLAEEERNDSLSRRLRTAATTLATSHADGSLPVQDINLELANQNGHKVHWRSEAGQRAIMMGLRANRTGLMKREKYRDALVVFNMGNDSLSLYNPKLLAMVDNVLILQINMVWCYLRLRDISWVSVAGIHLERAREGVERAHGKEYARIRILQGRRFPVLALQLGMVLLDGVIAYHFEHLQTYKDVLSTAQTRYFQLQDKAKSTQMKPKEDLQGKKEIVEQQTYGMPTLNKALNVKKLNQLVTNSAAFAPRRQPCVFDPGGDISRIAYVICDSLHCFVIPTLRTRWILTEGELIREYLYEYPHISII